MSYTMTIEAPEKAAWFEKRRLKVSQEQLGELFVTFLFDDHFDYTEWRKDHLFVGETVDTLVDKIRAFEREHP